MQISPHLVDAFADLTGDRSSLHMDEAFAARSAYRGRVAHGFLPVLSIAAALPRSGATPTRIARMSAQFLKPVFLNDRLKLRVEAPPSGGDGDAMTTEFTFCQADAGTPVTMARVTLCPDDAAPAAHTAVGSLPVSLPTEQPGEQDLHLGQIAKGDTAALSFRVTPAALARCRTLMASAFGVDRAASAEMWESPELMAACCVSTVAGMQLPGRRATLIDFVLAFDAPIRLDKTYRLTATVKHKSESTGTITARLTIEDELGNSPQASGQFTARVNEGPTRGPSVEDLRGQDVDLGLKESARRPRSCSRFMARKSSSTICAVMTKRGGSLTRSAPAAGTRLPSKATFRIVSKYSGSWPPHVSSTGRSTRW